MIATAAEIRALTTILAPYAGQPLNRTVIELALRLARLEAAK